MENAPVGIKAIFHEGKTSGSNSVTGEPCERQTDGDDDALLIHALELAEIDRSQQRPIGKHMAQPCLRCGGQMHRKVTDVGTFYRCEGYPWCVYNGFIDTYCMMRY